MYDVSGMCDDSEIKDLGEMYDVGRFYDDRRWKMTGIIDDSGIHNALFTLIRSRDHVLSPCKMTPHVCQRTDWPLR